MRRKEWASLSDVLSDLGMRLDRKSGGALSQTKVVLAWQRTAGDTVLAHTTGAHLREGEVVVYVDSPAWATELSALSERYREALETELGEKSVSAVRFSVSNRVDRKREEERLDEEADRFYEPDPAEPMALTASERAQVEASAAVIPDKDLREVVIKATIADLEWKKGRAEAKRREKPREGL